MLLEFDKCLGDHITTAQNSNGVLNRFVFEFE